MELENTKDYIKTGVKYKVKNCENVIFKCATTMTIRNVWDLKAVTYPHTLKLIKGTTAQFGTNTHIFFIVCYSQLIITTWT